MSKCKDCKYCGETTMEDNTYFCNNTKSIFKVCLKNATVCEKFELKAERGKENLCGK